MLNCNVTKVRVPTLDLLLNRTITLNRLKMIYP